MEKISVVITNYNFGKYVSAAIESVLIQDYSNKEIIVIDDGSTDNSQEIISKYQKQIITLFKKNGGQASAMNEGFLISTGDIIIFLDSDDYLLPDSLACIGSHWDCSFSKVHFKMEKKTDSGVFLGFHPNGLLDTGNVLARYLKNGDYTTTVTSGNAFKRSFLQKVLPIPPEFPYGDGYLNTVAPFHGPIGTIEKALVVYRQHSASDRHTVAINLAKIRSYALHEFHRFSILQKELAQRNTTLNTFFLYKNSDRIFHFLAVKIYNIPFPELKLPGVWILILLGLYTTWRYGRESSYSWKAGKCIWFLSLALPVPILQKKIISWKYAPSSRPGLFSAFFDLLKKMFFPIGR